MKHIFLFLLFLVISLSGFSQVLVDVNSLVIDIKTGKSESGVSIKIYDGSTVVAQGVTPSNGKLILKVPAEKKYKVEFSKAGKVTRFVMINATKIDVELLQGASEPYALIEMSMFEETPNVDYSFIKSNPVTEFYFDGKTPKLTNNTTTSASMKKEVDRALAAAANVSGNNEAQYQAKMKEGEALALQKKYAEAATKFEQALGFKKDDKIAMKRLDEMDKLDKANQISTLDGQAANAEFDNLVKAAEILKSQKKWQEAIDKYEEAYEKKKDQGVDDEINALMEIIRKEKKEKEAEGAYTAAMTAGDNLMKQKSYLPARDQYILALKAKPNDPVATKKKADVDLLIEAAKGAQEKKKLFDNTVTEADELYKLEKWAEAKVKYEDALKLESASTYVAGRITDTKAKIEAAEKERLKQEQITKLIAEGSAAIIAEQWDPALLKFNEVTKLDPENATAKEKLVLIKAKIEEQKQNAALEANFKKLVDEGDVLVKGLKFPEALAKYEAAELVKKDPALAQKIAATKAEIEKAKNQKELKEKFDLAMKDGEALIAASKWEEAKVKFIEASTLDDKAQAPKDKIKFVEDKMLAEQSAKQKTENYQAAMSKGEKLFGEGKLLEARVEFDAASKIDPLKTEPKDKILKIDNQLKAEAAQKDKVDKYAAAMKAGNDLRLAGKLTEAKAEYTKAKGIDGTQTEPDVKIKEVDDQILAESSAKSAKEKADKYAAAMKAGDDLRATGKLTEAKSEYTKAKGIDGTQTEPDVKIKEVDDQILAESSAKTAKEKADKYAAAMKAGDDLRATGKLTEAKAEYTKAKGIDGTQTEPDVKIKEVDDQILAEANSKSAKEKADKYAAEIKAGDDLRKAGKLAEARDEYSKAMNTDPVNPLADAKIKEVDDQILAESSAKSAKEKADKYAAAMKAGDDLRLAGKLTEAKAEYTKAKGIDGTQTEPDVKIKEVDDQILAEGSAKSAKEKADKYAAAMKAGDDLRLAGKLTEAKAEYTKAKGIDGTQTEPDVKIKEVDDQILAEASSKSAKEKADKYAAEIKAGDDLRKAGKLAEARDEYSKAKNTDPANPLADTKIKEVDAEIANLTSSMEKKKQVEDLMKVANELFAKEDFEGAIVKYDAVLAIDKQQAEAAKKKADAEAKLNAAKGQAEKEAAYLKFKNEGIEAYNQEKWYDARTSFSAAIKIKSDAELESKLKEVELKIASIEAEKNNEEAYKSLMQEANDLATAKKYDAAIKKYQDASSKKPLEKTPQEKIEALKELKQQDVAQQQIDAKYNDAMKKGNDAMTAEDFPLAIKHFNEANGIKPSEKEPVDKANQARERYEAQNLDFKIKYEKMLDAAQKFLDEGNWEKATNLYNRAKDIKKDDPLPNMKLAEIEEKKKAEEANKLLLAEKEKAFNAKMEAGEKAFKAKEFDQAISLFTEAKKLNAESKLPDARIEASNLEKSKLLDATKENELYAQAISAGDAAVKIGEYNQALAEYTNALKIKKGDKVAQDKLNEVAQIIDNQTNAAEEQKKKEAWTQQLNEADNLFKASQWTAAKEKYDALLKIQPKDSYVKAQKTKCVENEKKQAEQQKNYAKLLADAETSFRAGDLLKAKSLFEKAHEQNKNDQLPIDRLGEIDALLNPKVIASGPLANLGTPTDNSILEGQALLAKADNERKNRTNTAVSSQSDEIQKVVVAQANSKDEKIKDLSLELQEGAKQRELDAPSDDENRLDIVNNVKTNQQVLSEKASSDDKFENAESLDAISKMELEKSEIEKTTTEKTAVYTANKSIVEKAALILQDADMASQNNELKDGFKAQKILDTTVQIVAENTIQDDELRKLTEQGVRVSQESVVKLDAEKQVTEAQSNQKISDEVVKNNALKSNLDIESMKVVDHNVEVMDVVDAGVRELSNANQTRHVEKTLETQTRISNEIVTLSTKDGERDNNRKEAVEVLKKEDNELTEAQRAQYNALYLRTLDTRNTITTEVNKDYGVNREKEEALIAQTGVIQEKGNKVLTKSVTESQSDEGQRYLAKSTVSEKETQIAVVNTEKNGQSAANKEVLNKSEKELLNVDKKAQESQVQKNLDARKLIEKIESKQVVFDAKAANEIGKNYPEGVSQESFNQNGTDGLPVAIITRRIVVTNGYGAVYVRKQTLTGLTYSKNGEPSTEYIWQKETSDGKLVKNF